MTPIEKLKEARRLTAEAADDLYISLGYGNAGAPTRSTVAQIQRTTVRLHDLIVLLNKDYENSRIKNDARVKKLRGTPPDKA